MDSSPAHPPDARARNPESPWTGRDLAVAVGLLLLGYAAVIAVAVAVAVTVGEDDPNVTLALAIATLAFRIWLAALVLILATRRNLTLGQLGFRSLRGSALWWPFASWAGAFGIIVVYGAGLILVEELLGRDLSRLMEGNVSYPADTTTATWVVLGLAVVLAAPLGEELFFRSLVFRAVQARWGLLAGLIISGGLFALVHFEISVVLPFWLIGIWLAWTYHRSGSLWTPIVAHAIFNGVSFAAAVSGVTS